MGKEVVIAFIMMVAWVLVFLWAGQTILQAAAVFSFFLVKDSTESVTDTLSGIITVTAGVPDKARIIYFSPSSDYTYNVFFGKREVFVTGKYTGSEDYFNLGEEIERWLTRLPSTTGIDFEPKEDSIENFATISINKTLDNNNLKVVVGE